MTDPRPMYCPRCESDRAMAFERLDEAYRVMGESVTLNVPLWVCQTCGESIVDESFGDPCEKVLAKRKDGRDAED